MSQDANLRKELRALVFSWILLGAMPAVCPAAQAQGSTAEMAKQARALFKQQKYSEAATLARQVFAQEPDGRRSDALRVLLCEARTAGADVGDAATAYPEPAEPAKPRAPKESPVPPRKISGRNPSFSDRTRETREQGRVALSALINEDGCVQDLTVERGLNAYAEEDVLKVVRDWIFRPALVGGRPVKVHYTVGVSIEFK
jgi:TonB family protein